MKKRKLWVSYGIFLLLIPAVVLLSGTVFRGRQYAFLSMAVAFLSCVPFFLRFERREQSSTRLILIAVMTALSVLGRILFAALPGFKPVTALVLLTAIYFGGEAGFLTGALTAVLSNFYFGQGPWTPFQMFAWGLLGLLAGLLAKPLKEKLWLLCLFGALSGALYSAMMDIWSVLFADGSLRLSRYLVMLASSAPYTAIYCVSNVVFLLLLAKPIGRKLQRVKDKYGI